MNNLCLFDLDGTLTDPKVGITKSVRYALDYFGIMVDDLDDLKKIIGPPLRDSFRKYYNFSEEEAEEAVNKYREYFSGKGMEPLQAVKSSLDTVSGISNTIASIAPEITSSAKFVPGLNIIAGAAQDVSSGIDLATNWDTTFGNMVQKAFLIPLF